MNQTDPRAVAKGIISGWYQSTEAAAGFTLGIAEHEWQRLEAIIAAVLADAERRGLERAAEIAMKKAQEPWKLEAANREGMRIAQAIRAQARCAKFEAIVHDHQNGACNRTIAQLQATLAAREARIRELEDQMNAKRYVTNEAL